MAFIGQPNFLKSIGIIARTARDLVPGMQLLSVNSRVPSTVVPNFIVQAVPPTFVSNTIQINVDRLRDCEVRVARAVKMRPSKRCTPERVQQHQVPSFHYL